MRKTIVHAIACVLAGSAAIQDAAAIPEPCLVPMPQKCVFTPKCLVLGAEGIQRDRIHFSKDASLPAEGYRLTVDEAGISIVSSDSAGEFYAMQTLRQLAEKETKSEGTYLPYAQIEDAPAYRWRGMHFDEGRHFFGKQTLKRTLDLMAQHKYNVLAWHLTEDQGWRFEVPGRPELVQYGSVRPSSPKHGAIIRNVNGIRVMESDETRYGPFYYTEEEVKEIIAYAAERHIEVVPEIEMPGHIRAALAAYPEYACRPENLADRSPRTIWGVEKEVLCLGNPDALAFVDEVLAYVAKTFPAKHIVFWGEECPTERWAACPKCRALMAREGIKEPKELLAWFTRRMTGVIEKLGKRAIGADDCLAFDNIPKSLIGLYWRESAAEVNGAQGVALGHDMIMIPFSETYFYCEQGLPDDVDPFQYGTGSYTLTLERTYNFNPSRGVPSALNHRVLGGMGCNWSEFTWNEYDLQWKMWPRGCAMAEVLWTGAGRPGYANFFARMQRHRGRLISQGVNCAPLMKLK